VQAFVGKTINEIEKIPPGVKKPTVLLFSIEKFLCSELSFRFVHRMKLQNVARKK